MPTIALCISDLTSEEACLEYIYTLIRRHSPKLVIIPGDVTQDGPQDYAEDVLEICANAKLPIVCVHGNNDPEDIQKLLEEKTHYVHGRHETVLGFRFAGLGGSNPTPNDTVCEYTEEQIAEFLDGNVDDKTILVSHTPPSGTLDLSRKGTHTGSTTVKNVIEHSKPRAIICGHAHEQEGEAMLGSTKVIKVAPLMYGKAALVELESLKVTFVKV